MVESISAIEVDGDFPDMANYIEPDRRLSIISNISVISIPSGE